MLNGYERTPDCRYYHPSNPRQFYISKARAHEINPKVSEQILAAMRRAGQGPKAIEVNPKLLLYKVEDIAAMTPVVEQAPGVPEQDAIQAIRAINEAIRSGTLVVTQKPDGTLRALVEVG